MRRIHWGWSRRLPWTVRDVERIRREHPEYFVRDASPWWVLPGKEG